MMGHVPSSMAAGVDLLSTPYTYTRTCTDADRVKTKVNKGSFLTNKMHASKSGYTGAGISIQTGDVLIVNFDSSKTACVDHIMLQIHTFN